MEQEIDSGEGERMEFRDRQWGNKKKIQRGKPRRDRRVLEIL
jgi:hypothetical protein